VPTGAGGKGDRAKDQKAGDTFALPCGVNGNGAKKDGACTANRHGPMPDRARQYTVAVPRRQAKTCDGVHVIAQAIR